MLSNESVIAAVTAAEWYNISLHQAEVFFNFVGDDVAFFFAVDSEYHQSLLQVQFNIYEHELNMEWFL